MGKLQRIQSTQNFSPVRDVQNGIIITTDGRFIKLMEFSPVNFDLRSIDEQDAIISKFRSVLRAMPKTVQFKVVTKAADLTIFINNLIDCYEREPNENCRALIEEQINFISSIGSSMGTSRHFYVAFEYEQPEGLKKVSTFEEIAATLDRQGAQIAQGLKECGNGKISRDNDDNWTLSALHSIYRRAESERENFDNRVASIVASYAAETSGDLSEELVTLPVNNFICPDRIDPGRSPNYIVIDGIYYSFAVIRGESYPTRAVGGWTQMLVGLGEGIDLDIFFTKVDPAKANRQIQSKLRFGSLQMRKTDETSADYDALQTQLESGYYFKSNLAGGDEFCYFGAILTVTAYSAEDLERRMSEVKNICIRADMKLRACTFQQLDAFRMTLPFCKLDQSLWGKAKRNILLSQLASVYPFTSFEMSDRNGILLGTSVQNGTMVFIDPFDHAVYTNANIILFGTSGGGKTYTLLCLALRKRMRGEQVFIIAPMKGEEFEKACRGIGGEFIRIAPGSSQNINVMEIRKKEEMLEEEYDGAITESILAQKIQQLHTFFTYIIADAKHPMTQEEKNLLDQALLATYKRFGITTNNKSLIDRANPSQYKPMPILGDLYKELEKLGDGTARLRSALSIFVTGSASSFNGPTNVDLDNKFVVIDISHLSKDLLPVGMFIATDFVWDKARENRTKRKTIIIDEVWRLIGGYASEAAAEFVLDIFKVIRGYGGSAIAATQDLNDVLTLNGGQFGSAILNNTRLKMILRIESQNEAESIGRVLELTEKEIENIRMMERGTALLIANFNHVFVKIKASKKEHGLIAYGGAH